METVLPIGGQDALPHFTLRQARHTRFPASLRCGAAAAGAALTLASGIVASLIDWRNHAAHEHGKQ